MSSPANDTARGSQSGSVPPVQEGPAVVVGEQDPDFADPRAEADWIARALGHGALVTALVTDQFQLRQNKLQQPAGTQCLAGVPPARRAEHKR